MKTCQNCGQELVAGQRKWCSDECAELGNANKGAWWAAEMVVLRRSGWGYKAFCEYCGIEYERIKTGHGWFRANTTFEIHHIMPMDGDNRQHDMRNIPSNLIMLCRECHRRAHNWRRHADAVGWLKTPVTGQEGLL